MAQPELTTLPSLEDYLRVPLGGTPAENVLTGLIQAASRSIRQHTGRRFTTPPTPEARKYMTYGYSDVYVDEVFSEEDIASVVDSSGMAVSYEIDFGNEPDPHGATLQIKRASDSYGISGLPSQHVDNFVRELRPGWESALPAWVLVTGTFGYPQGGIPAEIEFAANRCVATWWKENVAQYTDDAFISRGRVFPPEELPPVVVASLKGWVARKRVAA